MTRLLKYSKGIIVVGASLTLIACSHTPMPLTEDEIKASVSLQTELQQPQQEAITKPLTLAEAVARAIKYNLDLQQRTYERLEKLAAADVASYAQWPELALEAQYNDRDTYSGGSSLSILPGGKSLGPESLEPSTSSERDVIDSSAEFSWNILDFGLSYVRARQASNQAMVYREEERKVMNRLVQEVRSLYWLAAASQRLLPELQQLHKDTNAALDDAQDIIDQRLKAPLEQLTYVRNLLDIKKQTESLINELGSAQIRLGALMNIQPGQRYELADYTEYNQYQLTMSVEEMERIALANRAEVRSLAYQKRILQDESKAAVLELLPGLRMYAGVNYTSNEYTYDDNWNNVGAQISWNLMNAFKYPGNRDLIDSRERALDAQQLSLTMAVIVQLHVALHEHISTTNTFDTSYKYSLAQEGIVNQMQSEVASGRISTQAFLYERLNTALAQLERDVAYANMEKGLADLFASMGLDPLPEQFEDTSVAGVANQLKVYWQELVTIANPEQVESADEYYEGEDSSSVDKETDNNFTAMAPTLINTADVIDGYTLNLASFSTKNPAFSYANKVDGTVIYDGKHYCVVKGKYPTLTQARNSAKSYRDAFARNLDVLNNTVIQ